MPKKKGPNMVPGHRVKIKDRGIDFSFGERFGYGTVTGRRASDNALIVQPDGWGNSVVFDEVHLLGDALQPARLRQDAVGSQSPSSPGFDLADGRHIDDKFIAHEDPTQKTRDDTKKMIEALKAEAAGNNAGITVKHHSVKQVGIPQTEWWKRDEAHISRDSNTITTDMHTKDGVSVLRSWRHGNQAYPIKRIVRHEHKEAKDDGSMDYKTAKDLKALGPDWEVMKDQRSVDFGFRPDLRGDEEVHNWDPFGDIFNLEFDTTELQTLVREASEIVHEFSPRRLIRFGHAHARQRHAHEGM